MLGRLFFDIFLSLSFLLVFSTPVYAASVVISEIMYNPAQDDNYNEWIEIYAFQDTDLTGWSLCGSQLKPGYVGRDGQVYNDSGMLIAAGQYALITDGGSGTEVYQNFSVSQDSLALHISGSSLCGGLSNSGDTVVLEASASGVVEEITYSPEWGGNGNGSSLARINLSVSGDDTSNWQESAVGGSPGFPNPTPTPTSTSTPSPTSASTPTSSPTSTPTATPTSTPTPTSQSDSKSTNSVKLDKTEKEILPFKSQGKDELVEDDFILGIQDIASQEPTPSVLAETASVSSQATSVALPFKKLFAFGFIGVGSLSVAFSGYLFWRQFKSDRINTHE